MIHYGTHEPSYTGFERLIEGRIDMERTSLSQDRLEQMLGPVNDPDRLIFLIRHGLGDIVPYYHDIDKMLGLPGGSSYTRHRRAYDMVSHQCMTFGPEVTLAQIENSVNTHAEGLLGKMFEARGKECPAYITEREVSDDNILRKSRQYGKPVK